MTNQNDLPGRVAKLERRMKKCRVDATAARVLAAAADRDVADIRLVLKGHTSVLNALRETQIDHGKKLKEHDDSFDRLEAKVDGLTANVDGLTAKVDGHDSRFDRLETTSRRCGRR